MKWSLGEPFAGTHYFEMQDLEGNLIEVSEEP
jgi:hypothetical protein